MRILRCEICKKPCMLNTLSDAHLAYCPADGKQVSWRQVNTAPAKHTGQARHPPV